MKIEYVRKLQFAYMQIALEEPFGKMEEEMLSHNIIDGFLPVHWQKEDNVYILRYDITGKQALDAMLENSQADEHILQSLLVGICAAVKQLEKYLLVQEGLLLCPEAVFWDYKSESMYFCYYPGEQQEMQTRFRTLMEYVLTKTDHRNKQAVELAYGVYEELLKPSFRLSEIQSHMQMLRKTEQGAAELEPVGENHEMKEETNEPEEKISTEAWLEGVRKRIMAWIKEQLHKFIERKKVTEPIVFEPEEEEIRQGLPTVLLAEAKEEIAGTLIYEGSHSLQDIQIRKVPFVIGSADTCDGIINDPTISHQHAKITKIDGVYFIEDLNSTNGTKVNGGLLSYKTKVSLRKNENICFAKEPYRFE